AKGVAVDSVGTVFLANGHDGLRAYSYDGNSFTNTAHINNNASGEADLEGASGVAVSSDGTIFLANGSKGMFAYTYSPASGFENNFSAVPQNHSLSQNYPNPFNESTTIFYTLKESAMVSLKIYDLLGREIKTLVNEFQDESNYSINFNGSGLRSGIYYYQLQIGNKFTETKKMVLLR
ncbi:T9SS type A sorting domain-containing protein, partial [candidate division KSB1 bacterium]|nr:T9SS type A sorting domain-containing protein [candidate division KSB1 bacterium]